MEARTSYNCEDHINLYSISAVHSFVLYLYHIHIIIIFIIIVISSSVFPKLIAFIFPIIIARIIYFAGDKSRTEAIWHLRVSNLNFLLSFQLIS